MAGNLISTAVDCLSSGEKLFADALIAELRISTCKSCEFFNAENTRCGKCGCYMNAKTKLQAAKCPVGKW